MAGPPPQAYQQPSGPHKTNRKNAAICDAFQSGSCGPAAPGNKCPSDSGKVHQCATCLSDRHGADSCGGDKGSGKGKKGKRSEKKGKGKGKGKGKKSW